MNVGNLAPNSFHTKLLTIVFIACLLREGTFGLLLVTPAATSATAAKEDLPEPSTLWRGHPFAVAGEYEKIEDSERRLHDHVGDNVEIQVPHLIDLPYNGRNHVKQVRRHKGQRVQNALIGDSPGLAVVVRLQGGKEELGKVAGDGKPALVALLVQRLRPRPIHVTSWSFFRTSRGFDVRSFRGCHWRFHDAWRKGYPNFLGGGNAWFFSVFDGLACLAGAFAFAVEFGGHGGMFLLVAFHFGCLILQDLFPCAGKIVRPGLVFQVLDRPKEEDHQDHADHDTGPNVHKGIKDFEFVGHDSPGALVTHTIEGGWDDPANIPVGIVGLEGNRDDGQDHRVGPDPDGYLLFES